MVSKFSQLAIVALLMQLLAYPVQAEKKVALVVGNATYQVANSLDNPINDAEAIAGKLEKIGFEVVLARDLTSANFSRKIQDFSVTLENAEIAVFYFAGHGVQLDGKNYLLSIDANVQGAHDLRNRTIALGSILSIMSAKAAHTVVFLDACRDNPFQGVLLREKQRQVASRSLQDSGRSTIIESVSEDSFQGLANEETVSGSSSFILYATEPQKVAYDSVGSNSPFSSVLSDWIDQPGLTLPALAQEVRTRVKELTGGLQSPTVNWGLDKAIMLAGLPIVEETIDNSGTTTTKHKNDILLQGENREETSLLLQPAESVPDLKPLAKEIQSELQSRRCYLSGLDGDFGPNSVESAINFAKSAKLPEPNLSNPITLAELASLRRLLDGNPSAKCAAARKKKQLSPSPARPENKSENCTYFHGQKRCSNQVLK